MPQMNVVYVLTNSAMPGLVKIGFTTQTDANLRISQLYTTGVPVPFNLEFACNVQNAEEVERALHEAFAPNRINPRREFFQINPEQAIAILRLLHVGDATIEVKQQPTDLDQQSIAAEGRLRSRRPNINFHEMGIPNGAELQSTHGSVVAIVTGPRKVTIGNEEMSFTGATRYVLGSNYNGELGHHWTYNGRNITEMYDETYGPAC